jgi:AcrR family transcriptional regulator
MDGPEGLRERKKERTRRALITAAADLFERQGYEATTVADIAAAADVATRTFFGYFPSKEAVLFADTGDRVRIALDVIAGRKATERPVDVLIRAVDEAIGSNLELLGRLGPVRVRLLLETPALHGQVMRSVLAAERQIAAALVAAYPEELDDLRVAAMVGSLIGALLAATTAVLADPSRLRELLAEPDRTRADITRAVRAALAELAAATAATLG